MATLEQIHARDGELIQIIESAVAESARRSGSWVVCRPGCTPCCLEPFAITWLDAQRLRRGLEGLNAADPLRAEAVRLRAVGYAAAIAPVYPGDPATGALHDEDAMPAGWEDQPCPALDPASGLCDLYDARPITCRVFGAATRIDNGAVGACELCYEGATDEQISACATVADPNGEEQALLAERSQPNTIVAFALTIPGEMK